MTVDEDLAQEATACDARFDGLQPMLIAELRARGVTEGDLPTALAAVHADYWRERGALLARLRTALVCIADLQRQLHRIHV